MRPTLEVQELIREHGIDHVQELLKLEVKHKGDLVLLKYNQIEADWTKSALYDCRGLILDKANNWEVVAYPYKKFFNSQEGYAAKIDWESAECMEKGDGSLITLYFYNNDWHVSTSGVPDASSTCNQGMHTFAELVWKTAKIVYGSKEEFLSRLNPSYNFMFELCTPMNLVITQHQEYKILLHGIRDMVTFNEVRIDSWPHLHQVKMYSFKTLDEARITFENMTWQEEGYIFVDKHFNRVKEKNPKYCQVHHIATGLSPYHIISVVKTNELSEFLSYFPSRKEELEGLQELYNNLVNKLYLIYNEHFKDFLGNDKEFATLVFKICTGDLKEFSGMYFGLRKNKFTIKQYLNTKSNRDLFHILKS